MNPTIDIKSFQSGNQGAERHEATQLVVPPRRTVTRYVLPIALFLAFAGMFAYATRDALIPVIEVQVVQPVVPSGATAAAAVVPGAPSADDEAPAGEKTANEAPAQAGATESPAPKPAIIGGQPIFQAPGWIEPDPFTTLVSSLIPGTLSEVYVREGQTVAPGMVVAELDSVDAQIALQKAEANLAVKQAELEAAQQNWDNPIVVQQALKTAEAEKARLEAEKIKLQRQYEFQTKLASISRQLGKSGADSVLAAEKAVLEARVAEATVHEINAKILAQEAILQAAASTAELRIEDKSQLALAKAQLQEATAAVDEAKVALERCKVTAPTTGTVMRLHKTPGAMVSSDVPEGTQIVSMYDPESLQVRAEVPLAEAGKIQIGLPAEIKVEAMPDKVFKGELTRVVHEADVQRNSLQVKVRILDPVPTLKPEMVARVQFKSLAKPIEIAPEDDRGKKADAAEAPATAQAPAGQGMLIPSSLVPRDAKDEAKLWLIGSDMRAHLKTVTLGDATQGELREISAGLQPSDKIIASNTDKLEEGSRVRIAAKQQGKD